MLVLRSGPGAGEPRCGVGMDVGSRCSCLRGSAFLCPSACSGGALAGAGRCSALPGSPVSPPGADPSLQGLPLGSLCDRPAWGTHAPGKVNSCIPVERWPGGVRQGAPVAPHGPSWDSCPFLTPRKWSEQRVTGAVLLVTRDLERVVLRRPKAPARWGLLPLEESRGGQGLGRGCWPAGGAGTWGSFSWGPGAVGGNHPHLIKPGVAPSPCQAEPWLCAGCRQGETGLASETRDLALAPAPAPQPTAPGLAPGPRADASVCSKGSSISGSEPRAPVHTASADAPRHPTGLRWPSVKPMLLVAGRACRPGESIRKARLRRLESGRSPSVPRVLAAVRGAALLSLPKPSVNQARCAARHLSVNLCTSLHLPGPRNSLADR